MNLKYAIALTGGIATGKSTVCKLLFLNGYRVVDADDIAHKLLDIHHLDIASMFGDEYVDNDKVIRSKLGQMIFHNQSQKNKLEQFLHPKIRIEILKQCQKLESLNFTYFVDIPLFFETNAYPEITKSVVVYTPYDEQLRRVMRRDNISEEFAKAKINSQMPIQEKMKLATYIVDNSKDLKHLQREIDKFMLEIE